MESAVYAAFLLILLSKMPPVAISWHKAGLFVAQRPHGGKASFTDVRTAELINATSPNRVAKRREPSMVTPRLLAPAARQLLCKPDPRRASGSAQVKPATPGAASCPGVAVGQGRTLPRLPAGCPLHVRSSGHPRLAP